jgi:ankyrin repeat protein
MTVSSGSADEATTCELMADLALRAPGRAAPRAALGLLDQLARRGDLAAALAVARVTGTELGLDVSALTTSRCPSFAALAGLAGTGGAPSLPCLLAAGYLPWQFAEDVSRWPERGPDLVSADTWAEFRALVARDAAAREFALRGYAMAAVLGMTTMMKRMASERKADTGFAARLATVAMGSRVVDGNNADTSFQFGAGLLRSTGPDGLLGRMAHELGHHFFGHNAGTGPGGPVRDVAADCAALAATLPDALATALDPPPGGPGFQVVTTPNGLRLGCSRDRHDRGELVHLSVSMPGTSVTRDQASALAHLAVRLLGASAVAVAISHGGVLHVGVPAAGVDLALTRERAAQPAEPVRLAVGYAADWLAELTAAGLWCAHEDDLRYVLGLESRPALIAADPSVAGADLDRLGLVARSDLTGLPPGELPELVKAAVRCGDPDAVARLIAAGAEPDDAGGGPGYPGIGTLGGSLAALWAGRLTGCALPTPDGLVMLVAELGRAGFDVSAAELDGGETLLTDAAARSLELTSALLGAGVNPAVRNARGATALEAARSAPVTEALLKAGADPDAADGDGVTALHEAAAAGDAARVRLLLSLGASANTPDRDGRTPLMLAGTPELVTILSDAGADIDAASLTGVTALMEGAHLGDEPVVRALLARGANVEAADAKGRTALHYAAQAPAGVHGTIAALIAAGAQVDEETDDGETALWLAAIVSREEAVETLIAAGGDANIADVKGITPLMCASWIGDNSRDPTYFDRMQACMRRLIGAGAAVDAADDQGRTALHFATKAFIADMTVILLEAGANPNVRDRDGRTPLSQARDMRRWGLTGGHGLMIQALLTHGAVDEPGGPDDRA